MAKPEKRWQLLLVADDGRITPFKRIKGIAVTLVLLLVILVLACAGLGWQLAAEKSRHRQTLARLTDANRQVVRYKSEHELISAELVLAQARMEKAGLTIHRQQLPIEQSEPEKTVDAKPVSKPKVDGGGNAPETIIAAKPTAIDQPPVPAAAKPAADGAKAAVSQDPPAKATQKPKTPVVAMNNLEVEHDAKQKVLVARFRVKNTGPRTSPVAGRCVVVLKADRMDPAAWLAMPRVTLVNGRPDGARGQAFKIARYKDMEIKAIGQADPSIFKTATVYVFDSSGAKLLEKDFSIDLPAPKPDPKPIVVPAAQPAGTSETTAAPTPPIPTPTEDPSLTEGVEPVEKEDTRSQF